MPSESNPTQKRFLDHVVPSQWMDQVRAEFTDVPERRLMIALLFDVIRVLHTGSPKERAEVSAWIRGTNRARIPFHLLCESLELEPTCLARRLLHGKVARASRFRARRTTVPTTTAAAPSVPVCVDEGPRASSESSTDETTTTIAAG